MQCADISVQVQAPRPNYLYTKEIYTADTHNNELQVLNTKAQEIGIKGRGN